MRQLGLQLQFSQVFSAQQYRSQALHEMHKTELTHSSYIEERKEALVKMFEKLNLKSRSSTEFLKFVGQKMLEITIAFENRTDGFDIWELCNDLSTLAENKEEFQFVRTNSSSLDDGSKHTTKYEFINEIPKEQAVGDLELEFEEVVKKDSHKMDPDIL